MEPNEYYKKLNEQYEEWEKQHRERIKRLKVVRAFGIGLMIWFTTVLLLFVATFVFYERLQPILDLVLFIGNAGVILFMIWSWEKETPTKLKWLLVAGMGFNAYWVIDFLIKHT